MEHETSREEAMKHETPQNVKRFEDLKIFQMARDLTKEVYAITKKGDFHKDSRFVQQIHAAAGSIMDNIAEGFERDGNKEFVNFLYIAKGSCGEVRSQIIRASDVGFIDNETATKLYNDCLNLSKSISKFISSLKSSPLTGIKFQDSSSKPETWNMEHETSRFAGAEKLETWILKHETKI